VENKKFQHFSFGVKQGVSSPRPLSDGGGIISMPLVTRIEIMKIALFFANFSSSLELVEIKEVWTTIQLVLDK